MHTALVLVALFGAYCTQASWQTNFHSIQQIESIFQVNGDHDYVLRNAPVSYEWVVSTNGTDWLPIPQTITKNETRLFRLHKLTPPVYAGHLKINILKTNGKARVYGKSQ